MVNIVEGGDDSPIYDSLPNDGTDGQGAALAYGGPRWFEVFSRSAP